MKSEEIEKSPWIAALVQGVCYTIYVTSIVISVLLMAHIEFFATTMNLWVIEKALMLFMLSTFMIIFGLLLRGSQKSAEKVLVFGLLLIVILWLHTSIVHF